MKKTILSITLFLVVICQTTIHAQGDLERKWGVELRPYIAFPVQDIGGSDLKTGFGSELSFSYRFLPNLSGYLGWSYTRFGSDRAFAGSGTHFEETGYTFGLQYERALGNSPLSIFIRGGGILNHIETEDDNGDIKADSGHGLGWQLGSGLVIPLNERWRLMPGLRYRCLPTDIDINNIEHDADLRYFSLGVSISRNF